MTKKDKKDLEFIERLMQFESITQKEDLFKFLLENTKRHLNIMEKEVNTCFHGHLNAGWAIDKVSALEKLTRVWDLIPEGRE